MSQRVIVGLQPDSDVDSIKGELESSGAESVQGPALELPNVLIVVIPDDLDVNEFIQLARMVSGVHYAEPDSWQFTA